MKAKFGEKPNELYAKWTKNDQNIILNLIYSKIVLKVT